MTTDFFAVLIGNLMALVKRFVTNQESDVLRRAWPASIRVGSKRAHERALAVIAVAIVIAGGYFVIRDLRPADGPPDAAAAAFKQLTFQAGSLSPDGKWFVYATPCSAKPKTKPSTSVQANVADAIGSCVDEATAVRSPKSPPPDVAFWKSKLTSVMPVACAKTRGNLTRAGPRRYPIGLRV